MNMPMIHDAALHTLIDQVRNAASEGRQLDIRGGDTKAFLGGARRGEPLALRQLTGVSSYEPTELVVTARAGTLLSELEATLADAGQYLPFDPPRFAPGGTVGGMVAAGLAGPARAAVGSVRDYVLGMTLLTDGLKLAAGRTLERLLTTWTSTRWRGLLTGFMLTALVQSSSALTVAVISFLTSSPP